MVDDLIGTKTKLVVEKGVFKATLEINSAYIFDSDLEQLKMFAHHMHGILDYSQKSGPRPNRIGEFSDADIR